MVCTNGLSAQSLLLISCANSELNSEPQAAAYFGSHQLSLLLLHQILCSTKFLLCTLHQISLCSAAPNFSFCSAAPVSSLLCSTKFSLVLSSTKFSFAFCLLLCAESSMLLSHTGINPGLEAQSNFVFLVCGTPDQLKRNLVKLMTIL